MNGHYKVSESNLQDKTSLTKREMDKYGGNSVTGRMSAGDSPDGARLNPQLLKWIKWGKGLGKKAGIFTSKILNLCGEK